MLSSVVLASLSGARESARDARRVQDFRTLRQAVQRYKLEEGEYPGIGDTGNQISSNCPETRLYQDLVKKSYLSEMPTDPAENIKDCGGNSIHVTDATDDGYYYSWDYNNSGGDICVAINNFETYSAGESQIRTYNGKPDNNYGHGANLRHAEFVYCFEDEQYIE